MELVLLQFLNSGVEATDRGEHFVVLLFEALDLLAGVDDGLVKFSDLYHCLLVGFLCLIEMLLHVASGSDGLDCQSLLSLELILEVVSFTY